MELAEHNGYKAEKHDVKTEDGYILTIHRIPPKKHCSAKSPILIAHGLLQASEGYVDSGPFAPGFVLAEECYDVWCGNARGNYNSRRHVNLRPDKDVEFWRFSMDQIGKYDTPAMVDYVLDNTKSKKLIFIGASQGGGGYFVMNSEKPEYAEKISLFVGLAPATRLLHTKSLVVKSAAKAFDVFKLKLEAAGVWEVQRKGGLIQGPLSILCQSRLVAAALCVTLISAVDSPHPQSITPEIQTRIIKHLPAGTSVQNIAHFGQAAESGKFVKFDYGPKENMDRYGSYVPPEYNLSASTAPALILHGLSDNVVDTEDLKWVVNQLPNVLEFKEVDDPLWTHFDMAYGKRWNETVFSQMKTYLYKYDDVF
ncbi:lipase 3-like [Choristoneura fumiferana]|uniref:lipase 3-like n=1 Tax=Choristoneura fumiferana TaxID=7141 RepID=UPI003D15B2FF